MDLSYGLMVNYIVRHGDKGCLLISSDLYIGFCSGRSSV